MLACGGEDIFCHPSPTRGEGAKQARKGLILLNKTVVESVLSVTQKHVLSSDAGAGMILPAN